MPRLLALLLTAALATGCATPTGEVADPPVSRTAAADTGYVEGPASRGGTGRFYFGREIARTMSHRGAAWLERPERAETEQPEAVVDALALRPDDVVADIGAGTGYFTLRMAARVPEGAVYAVDVQPEMLAMLEERAAQEGAANVVPVLGAEDDPNLPAASVDLALMVDAYHEFGYPREMMAALRRALVPGGRVVLVEYRGEDADLPIRPLHKMTEGQVRRELAAAGFEWVETQDFLPHQHLLVFRKPEEGAVE